MRKKILGEIVGILMIVFHFALIYIVIIYYRKDRFLPEEMKTTLGITIPMFAVYVGTIIKSFIANQSHKSKGSKVRLTYTFICFLIPLLYCSFVLSIILDQISDVRNQKFQDFVSQLTIAETAFAAFTGFIISDLFGESHITLDTNETTKNLDKSNDETSA